MPINGVGQNPGMNALQEMANAGNIDGSKNIQNLLDIDNIPDVKKPKDSPDVFLPDKAKTNTDMKTLNDWLVATPTPGALLAAICVKDAAQQYEQNQKLVFENSQSVQKNILEQAQDIKNGALKQFIFSVAGSAVSAVGCAVSTYKTAKLDTGLDQNTFTKQKAMGDTWATAGKIGEQTLNSIGTYLNAREQADVKKLDAAIEQHRTTMEYLKSSSQAANDLMRKSIEFMDAMQSNANQTRTKILG